MPPVPRVCVIDRSAVTGLRGLQELCLQYGQPLLVLLATEDAAAAGSWLVRCAASSVQWPGFFP